MPVSLRTLQSALEKQADKKARSRWKSTTTCRISRTMCKELNGFEPASNSAARESSGDRQKYQSYSRKTKTGALPPKVTVPTPPPNYERKTTQQPNEPLVERTESLYPSGTSLHNHGYDIINRERKRKKTNRKPRYDKKQGSNTSNREHDNEDNNRKHEYDSFHRDHKHENGHRDHQYENTHKEHEHDNINNDHGH
ncbi:myb-like protein A [Drosophila obscura]|uniref:myb-like protein A n=1 Tax=Drosophila obscura TaxID=7282 RepID=UPI001BB2C528|nr:myb-like protein A [Drosophila obscura]